MDWLEKKINDFMETWAKENLGHLTVADVHSFDKIYPGDGKRGTFVLIVFDRHPASAYELDAIEFKARLNSKD